MLTGPLQRIFSVARKEAVHIRRDPMTFFFALALPLVEMFMPMQGGSNAYCKQLPPTEPAP